MSTRGTMIKMKMSDGAEIGVYHVEPAGKRRGGLVLIQEIFGVTEHIKECCDLFASHGYEVLGPAIYDREAPGLQADYTPEGIQQAIKIARRGFFRRCRQGRSGLGEAGEGIGCRQNAADFPARIAEGGDDRVDAIDPQGIGAPFRRRELGLAPFRVDAGALAFVTFGRGVAAAHGEGLIGLPSIGRYRRRRPR